MAAKNKLQDELAKVQAELNRLTKQQQAEKEAEEAKARARAELAQKVAALNEQATAIQRELDKWAMLERRERRLPVAEEALQALENLYNAAARYRQVQTEPTSILTDIMYLPMLRNNIEACRQKIEAEKAELAALRARLQKH